MTVKTAVDSFTQIATVRIDLKNSDPPIWRVVEVPTSVTLKGLHDIVQVAMGWFDFHLWEMEIGGKTYGLPTDEDWGATHRTPTTCTLLRDVLQAGRNRIAYTYDFGDNWEHTFVVSDVRAGEAGTRYPRFIRGERNCPPEDCGGIRGFHEMLEARADPDHPDHVKLREWLDGHDPDELDVFPIKAALDRIAARRNVVAKRVIRTAND